jgi:hypothetical protein
MSSLVGNAVILGSKRACTQQVITEKTCTAAFMNITSRRHVTVSAFANSLLYTYHLLHPVDDALKELQPRPVQEEAPVGEGKPGTHTSLR